MTRTATRSTLSDATDRAFAIAHYVAEYAGYDGRRMEVMQLGRFPSNVDVLDLAARNTKLGGVVLYRVSSVSPTGDRSLSYYIGIDGQARILVWAEEGLPTLGAEDTEDQSAQEIAAYLTKGIDARSRVLRNTFETTRDEVTA